MIGYCLGLRCGLPSDLSEQHKASFLALNFKLHTLELLVLKAKCLATA